MVGNSVWQSGKGSLHFSTFDLGKDRKVVVLFGAGGAADARARGVVVVVLRVGSAREESVHDALTQRPGAPRRGLDVVPQRPEDVGVVHVVPLVELLEAPVGRVGENEHLPTTPRAFARRRRISLTFC